MVQTISYLRWRIFGGANVIDQNTIAKIANIAKYRRDWCAGQGNVWQSRRFWQLTGITSRKAIATLRSQGNLQLL